MLIFCLYALNSNESDYFGQIKDHSSVEYTQTLLDDGGAEGVSGWGIIHTLTKSICESRQHQALTQAAWPSVGTNAEQGLNNAVNRELCGAATKRSQTRARNRSANGSFSFVDYFFSGFYNRRQTTPFPFNNIF